MLFHCMMFSIFLKRKIMKIAVAVVYSFGTHFGVVWRAGKVIQWINLNQVDKCWQNVLYYPPDKRFIQWTAISILWTSGARLNCAERITLSRGKHYYEIIWTIFTMPMVNDSEIDLLFWLGGGGRGRVWLNFYSLKVLLETFIYYHSAKRVYSGVLCGAAHDSCWSR